MTDPVARGSGRGLRSAIAVGIGFVLLVPPTPTAAAASSGELTVAAPETASAVTRHHTGQLRVLLRGVPERKTRHVRVVGPPQKPGEKRFRQPLRRQSNRLTGLTPGRYRIIATRFRVLGGSARPTTRVIEVRIRAGSSQRVVVRYRTTWTQSAIPYQLDQAKWPAGRAAAMDLLRKLPDQLSGIKSDPHGSDLVSTRKDRAAERAGFNVPATRLYLTERGNPAVLVELGSTGYGTGSLGIPAEMVGPSCTSVRGTKLYRRMFAASPNGSDWDDTLSTVGGLRSSGAKWLRCHLNSRSQRIQDNHALVWTTPDGRINSINAVSTRYRALIARAMVVASSGTEGVVVDPGPARASAASVAFQRSNAGPAADPAAVAATAADRGSGRLRIRIPGRGYWSGSRYVIKGPPQRRGVSEYRRVASGPRALSGLRPGRYTVVARSLDQFGGRSKPKQRTQRVRVTAGSTVSVRIKYRTTWPDPPDPYQLSVTAWPKTLGGWESLLLRVGGVEPKLRVISGLELDGGPLPAAPTVDLETRINGRRGAISVGMADGLGSGRPQPSVAFPLILGVLDSPGGPDGCRAAEGSLAYGQLLAAADKHQRMRHYRILVQLTVIRSKGFFWLQCDSSGTVDWSGEGRAAIMTWAGAGPWQVMVAADGPGLRDRLREALVTEQRA